MISNIDIQNITKDYGNHKGVFDVSFSVKQGEITGFLGPNGAGKTTIIRHLMGFITPDQGTVRILNKDCFKEADSIQQEVGYLPGEITLIDSMTGIEFIHFIASLKGLKTLDRANELLQFFDLDASIKIKKMSKGMKQKIGIICAFMHNPSILILDEPTSGLDPLMQNKFISLILEEKKKGKTILMSSHIFEEIEKTCDQVIIIKKGRIVAKTDIKQLQLNKIRHFQITVSSLKEVQQLLQFYPTAKVQDTSLVIQTTDITTFIKHIASVTVLDLTVMKQTIEQMFLSLYGGEQHD